MSAKSDSAKTREVFAGALLGITTVLALILILHHPVLKLGSDVAELAASAQPVAAQDRMVHGGLIGMFCLQGLALFIFSTSLGLRRASVVGGMAAFFAGAVVMAIPTMLDGFVFPDFAAACLRASGGCGDQQSAVVHLISVMIQDFTKLALVLMAVGTLSWTVALLTGKGVALKIGGVIGLACAALPLVTLMFSDVYLKPSNLAGVTTAQLVWSLLVAVLLVTGAVTRDRADF